MHILFLVWDHHQRSALMCQLSLIIRHWYGLKPQYRWMELLQVFYFFSEIIFHWYTYCKRANSPYLPVRFYTIILFQWAYEQHFLPLVKKNLVKQGTGLYHDERRYITFFLFFLLHAGGVATEHLTYLALLSNQNIKGHLTIRKNNFLLTQEILEPIVCALLVQHI